MTGEKNHADLDRVLVIKESQKDEYSVPDSNLTFDVAIQDDGSLAITGGRIETPYFIQDSALDFVKSWRFELHHVALTGIHVDAAKNMLTYSFTMDDPTDFLEYTAIASNEEKSDG